MGKKDAIYEGVLLDELITFFGTDDVDELKFTAIDQHEISFDMDFLEKYRIPLATKENGKYISIRNKGPMRVIFVDYDPSKKEYELNLPLWVWMIEKIEL